MKHFKTLSGHCVLILIMFLSWPKNSCAQQYTQEFSRFGKITFPTKTHKRSNNSDTVYSIKYKSDIYALSIHSFRHDTSFTLDSGHLRELYDGFVHQLLETGKITLIYNKPVTISGLEGIEIKYNVKFSDTPYTSYHRILYVNRTIYNYGLSTVNDSDKTAMDKKDNFLNSFTITEKKKNLYQFYEVEDDNNSWEAALAKLIVDIIVLLLKVGFLCLVAVGLIYLFKAIFN